MKNYKTRILYFQNGTNVIKTRVLVFSINERKDFVIP